MELIVPYEDVIEVSRELKKSKCQEIVDAGESNHNLKVTIWSVKVECRGFPKLPQRHWFSGADSTKHLNRMGEIAQRASNSI